MMVGAPRREAVCSTTGPKAPSLVDQVVNHVVVVVGHVAGRVARTRREAYNRSAVSLPPFGARSGRSRVPSRRRRPPFRAALEPQPPPARSTFSAASKTTRVVLCCQISAGAGAVSLTPIKLLSIGCVRGDRCWCGAQRTRSRRDAPHPRAGESRARAACAWVSMTLREVLEEVEKLSPTGSSSLWWSQRTVPVRVVVAHG